MLATFLLAANVGYGQNFPYPLEKYINDYADILTNEEENELHFILKELDERHGVEFTFVGINSTSDYGHDGRIEVFATRLFNEWGVGDRQRNDGVMLLVAKADRELRIEVGSGYGWSQNQPMKRVIDNWIIPSFKKDEFGTGIIQGVEQAIFEITGTYPRYHDSGPVINWWIWLKRTLGATLGVALIPLSWFGWKSYKAARRRYPRKCPVDGAYMGRVLEEYEMNHLKDGQMTEEEIGSIDYDVWKCPDCAHTIIEAYPKRGRRYGACRECGFKTVESDDVTMRSPTKTVEGLKRTDYACRHCKAKYSVDSSIPTLPMDFDSDSGSWSSGGGGSFGGGSSSGGGASGSW